MKGALLVSEDGHLFESARDVVVARGGTSVEDAAQLRGPDGFLLTVFRDDGSAGDDFRHEPVVPADGATELPRMAAVHGVTVECRSETLFVDVVRSIAAAVDRPVWVLDNDSVLWPADALDPSTLSL